MRRIPVNLASNPFEQRQWLRRVKRLTVGIAALLTAIHLLAAWPLLDQPRVASRGDEAIVPMREWSTEVADALTNADPRRAQRVAVSVGMANALIEQRSFPWGDLFSVLEQITPDDVRLEMIQPVNTVDGVRVSLTAASGTGDALLDFLSALEERWEFHSVYPGRRVLGPDGDLRLSVELLARRGPWDETVGEERRP